MPGLRSHAVVKPMRRVVPSSSPASGSPVSGDADARSAIRDRCLAALNRVVGEYERRRTHDGGYVRRQLLRVDMQGPDQDGGLARMLRTRDEGEVPAEISDRRLKTMSWAVVLGSAGSGKSAIVRELFLRAAEAFRTSPEAPFPVIVDLEGLGSGTVLETADGLYRGAICCALQQGIRVSLYVDGVDEAARRRPDLQAALSRLVGDVDPARLIVGCRTSRWSEAWYDALVPDGWTAGHPEYTADRLEPEAYDQLLDSREQRDAFFEACSDVGVRDLLDSVFDGFWLARRYARGEPLPSSRQLCLEEQVQERLRRDSGGVSADRLAELARHLAVASTFGARPSWTIHDAIHALGASDVSRSLIGANEGEVRALLQSALFRAVGEGTYAFAHQLYREHLTAEALSAVLLPTLRTLLTVRLDGRTRVVPQHRALAAMLADRIPAWWDRVLVIEPRALLFAESRSGQAARSSSFIQRVVDEAVDDGVPVG